MRQALYRKYRPRDFDGVLGQDNIVNILKNQIKGGKISHAYIFSGSRGTGKTSCAKIFSKAVNCLNPQDGNPCNECENCKLIMEEATMDVIEMDAASNRRIDDIRQLRDKVIYPPSNLKYKVYIIDEAHMITNEGFNALLKIMEEPPKHLIFILATTEIDKIPDTILSRTQRFEFKKIDRESIEKQIELILDNEDIRIDSRGVEVISNIAQGGMRDALSILDQVISLNKKEIPLEDIYDLLGVFSDRVKNDYFKFVLSRDVKSLLSLVEYELDKGKDPHNFVKELQEFVRDLILEKLDIKEKKSSVKNFDDLSLERLTAYLDLLIEYDDLMKKSDKQNMLFQIASIRLLDYMPRKDLESRIKILNERLVSLEERVDSIISQDDSGFDNKKPVRKISSPLKKNEDENKDVIEERALNEDETKNRFEDFTGNEAESQKVDFLEEFDDQEDQENQQDQEGFLRKRAFEEREESTLEKTEKPLNEVLEEDLQEDIIKESIEISTNNYPNTRSIFNGLVDSSIRGDIIHFSVTSDSFIYVGSMRFFIKKVEEKLSNKYNRNIEIKFSESKDEKNRESETVKKLREFFPEEKLIIKK